MQTMDYDAAVKNGLIQLIDPAVPYLEQIAKLVDLDVLKGAGLDVVVDPMWGVGQGWFPNIFDGGKTRIHEIHNIRHPLFPEMARPEPIADNLTTLLRTIPELGADAGVAFDGDADRVGFASETGEFVNQLQVYALLALYLLECKQQRGPLVRTISTTSSEQARSPWCPVYETGVGFNPSPPRCLGRRYLGREESGGFTFAHHIPERDGIWQVCTLDLMIRLDKKPSELIDYLYSLVGPHYYNRSTAAWSPRTALPLLRGQAARGDRRRPQGGGDRHAGWVPVCPGGWRLVVDPLLRH